MGVTRQSERLTRILALLRERGSIRLQDLAELTDASPATVRRDAAELVERGLAVRTHGALHLTGIHAVKGEGRTVVDALGLAVAAQLPPGKITVALGGGEAMIGVLRAIGERRDMTLVTNSLRVAQQASGMGQRRVLMAGGMVHRESLETAGQLTEAVVQRTKITTAVVSCTGLSASLGASMPGSAQAQVAHAMLSQSTQSIVVAEAAALGQEYPGLIAHPSEIDVVVTDSPDEDELDALSDQGVKIVTATPAAEQ